MLLPSALMVRPSKSTGRIDAPLGQSAAQRVDVQVPGVVLLLGLVELGVRRDGLHRDLEAGLLQVVLELGRRLLVGGVVRDRRAPARGVLPASSSLALSTLPFAPAGYASYVLKPSVAGGISVVIGAATVCAAEGLDEPVPVDGVVERLADRQVGDPLGVDGQPVTRSGVGASSVRVLERRVAGDLGDQRGRRRRSSAERGLVGAVVGDDAVGRGGRGPAPKVHTNLSGYWWRTGSVAGSQCSLRSSTSSHAGACSW